MRKTPLLLLATVFLMACGQTNSAPSEMNENEVLNEQELNAAGQVSVDFLAKAELWPSADVIGKHADYYANNAQPDSLNFWKVGTIQNGDYAEQSLVLAYERWDGPGEASISRYAVDEKTDHWTALLPYSDEINENMPGGPALDQEASIDIPALDAPDTLALYTNDGTTLADARSQLDPNFYEDPGEVLITKENFATMYLPTTLADSTFPHYFKANGSTCIYGSTPDGVLVRYQVMPNIFGTTPPAKENPYAEVITVKTFTFKTTDGQESQREYMLFAGGCGFNASCLSTQEAASGEEKNLTQVGTLDGRSVYMISGVKTFEQDTIYESSISYLVGQAYNSYIMGWQYQQEGTAKITLDEFLTAHNVLLLKLDGGSYTLAYDSAYAPSVECGKPVIYLYPTTPEKVSVQVGKIAFSKTVPAYGKNGWTVWANPDGSLKNLADGLIYPYLFWEGKSSASVAAGDGWTLAKKDIAAKLPVALTSMGLSAKESADFMEFWLPKLQAVTQPYVLFTFEGTAAMNQVAPLTITPAPDSLLRVFMVYQGVNAPGRSMPAYTAPARTGFSVVEWGGTLY